MLDDIISLDQIFSQKYFHRLISLKYYNYALELINFNFN